MKSIIPLFFVCFLTFPCVAQKIVQEESEKKRVFLFAGQSNMEGRADGAQLSEADINRLEKVGNRVQFFYNKQPATPLQLTTPSSSIQKKFNLSKSFGPEIFFGIELAEKYPNDEFIFIKISKGGTSLYGCWNPYWSEKNAAHMNELHQPKLFYDFMEYVNQVLINYNTKEYEISGMLWVQGEADSDVKKRGDEPANSYGENLRNLIKKVRKEFENFNLPFVIFQVGSGKVVEGMKQTAETDKNVYLILQSKDENAPDYYKKNPPPIGHYTAKSMKRIGEEFFHIYESILE